MDTPLSDLPYADWPGLYSGGTGTGSTGAQLPAWWPGELGDLTGTAPAGTDPASTDPASTDQAGADQGGTDQAGSEPTATDLSNWWSSLLNGQNGAAPATEAPADSAGGATGPGTPSTQLANSPASRTDGGITSSELADPSTTESGTGPATPDTATPDTTTSDTTTSDTTTSDQTAADQSAAPSLDPAADQADTTTSSSGLPDWWPSWLGDGTGATSPQSGLTGWPTQDWSYSDLMNWFSNLQQIF